MRVFLVNVRQMLSYLVDVLKSHPRRHEQYDLRHLRVHLPRNCHNLRFRVHFIQRLFKGLDAFQELTSNDFAVGSCDEDWIEDCGATFGVDCDFFVEISVKELPGKFPVIIRTLLDSLGPPIDNKFIIPEDSPFGGEALDR